MKLVKAFVKAHTWHNLLTTRSIPGPSELDALDGSRDAIVLLG